MSSSSEKFLINLYVPCRDMIFKIVICMVEGHGSDLVLIALTFYFDDPSFVSDLSLSQYQKGHSASQI